MNAIATARTSGKSGPVLIFVHGVGSTAAIWDYQLAPLAAEFRCFAVELRGNGVPKPEEAPERITRAGFVDDVLSVADAAGAERFHFVGCSLGGVVGFELWQRARERVRSLVFVGSFACYPNAQAYVENIIASVLAAGNMEQFARERAARIGMPPGKRTDETIEQYACKSIPSYEASTYATWTGDYRAILGSITVPSLVVCGTNDAIAPPKLSQEISDGITGAQLEIIAGAGHVTNADAPEAFNALLRDFLQQS